MNRATRVLATVLTVSLAALAAPLVAGTSWFVAGSFVVGDLGFSVVYHDPYVGRSAIPYYRVDRPLPYRHYRCHSGCSYRRGAHYHHPRCSAVRHHFRRYDYHPGRYLSSVPPHYYGSYRDGRLYRHHDRHYYDDRYRRHWGRKGHHRHDHGRRGWRSSRHSHGGSCHGHHH